MLSNTLSLGWSPWSSSVILFLASKLGGLCWGCPIVVARHAAGSDFTRPVVVHPKICLLKYAIHIIFLRHRNLCAICCGKELDVIESNILTFQDGHAPNNH